MKQRAKKPGEHFWVSPSSAKWTGDWGNHVTPEVISEENIRHPPATEWNQIVDSIPWRKCCNEEIRSSRGVWWGCPPLTSVGMQQLWALPSWLEYCRSTWYNLSTQSILSINLNTLAMNFCGAKSFFSFFFFYILIYGTPLAGACFWENSDSH